MVQETVFWGLRSAVGYKQIDEPIVVVVLPNAIEGHSEIRNDTSRSDLRKSFVAIISIQRIASRGAPVAAIGHEKVKKPVVVNISPGAPGGVSAVGYNAAGGNLRKGPVTVV